MQISVVILHVARNQWKMEPILHLVNNNVFYSNYYQRPLPCSVEKRVCVSGFYVDMHILDKNRRPVCSFMSILANTYISHEKTILNHLYSELCFVSSLLDSSGKCMN